MLNIHPILPIMVLCKNRLRYLDTTLKSLSATIPSVPVYLVSDGSTNPSFIEYLTTQNKIEVNDSPYPNSDEWIKYAGFLPNKTHVQGILGKFYIILRRQSTGLQNLGFAANLIFQNHPKAKHIIKIEDDVIFPKNWYSRFCNTVANSSAGLVSGFRNFFKPISFQNNILLSGYTTAQLFAISRTLWNKQPDLKNAPCTIFGTDEKLTPDDYWIDKCREVNMNVEVTKISYCQHIGIISEFWGNRFKPSHINRMDRQLLPPFAISDSIKTFASNLLEV